MNFVDDSHGEELSFEVNVISLVDILFLLVIFFAVTTTFSGEKGIAVDLPKAQAGTVTDSKKPFTVTIPNDQSLVVDGKSLSIEEFTARLGSIPKENAGPFVIRADKKVSHGRVVQVMELARTSGVTDIAFATATE